MVGLIASTPTKLVRTEKASQMRTRTKLSHVPCTAAGKKLWSNIMEILDEKDGVDTELLVYGMTLINKVGRRLFILTDTLQFGFCLKAFYWNINMFIGLSSTFPVF